MTFTMMTPLVAVLMVALAVNSVAGTVLAIDLVLDLVVLHELAGVSRAPQRCCAHRRPMLIGNWR